MLFFIEIEKQNFKIHMGAQKTRDRQSTLRKTMQKVLQHHNITPAMLPRQPNQHAAASKTDAQIKRTTHETPG